MKPKGRRKSTFVVEDAVQENEISGKEVAEGCSSQERQAKSRLANVKCLECHCVGTVMNTIDGIVLFPNKVKKTLLELGGGMFMPRIKFVKPTVKIANNKVQKFMEGFSKTEVNGGCFGKLRKKLAKGIESAQDEKKLEVVKMAEQLKREKTKTSAPDQFTGFFSDEFETDNFWKSKKRFSLQ